MIYLQGEVLIRVHYSGVNYKDSLAAIPTETLLATYPDRSELIWLVLSFHLRIPALKKETKSLRPPYGIGVSQSGGYSQFARVPAEWIVPFPDGLTMKEAMIIGTGRFHCASIGSAAGRK